MVTSRDVAVAAGVSQATVSRVLSDSDSVSAATRDRVLDAVRRVGYVPNRSARAMRTGRTGTVGVVVADLANPFYPQLVEALSRELEHHGLRLTVWVSDGGKNDAALAAIAERSVDGVVFTTVDEESPELRAALERGSPLVLVNRTLPRVDCDQVGSANARGARLLTEHLLATGCTRPAFVGGTATSTTTSERLQGFRDALSAAGVEPVSVTSGEYSYDSGRARVQDLLDSDARPDAVVCSNDLLAFGALDAAAQRGLRVPEELQVVGYDDVDMAAWARFSLTTVRQDVDELAGHAVALLRRRIATPAAAPQRREVEPALVLRTTTLRAR